MTGGDQLDLDAHVVAFDAHCSCGASHVGAYNAADVGLWAETHDHDDSEADDE